MNIIIVGNGRMGQLIADTAAHREESASFPYGRAQSSDTG